MPKCLQGGCTDEAESDGNYCSLHAGELNGGDMAEADLEPLGLEHDEDEGGRDLEDADDD